MKSLDLYYSSPYNSHVRKEEVITITLPEILIRHIKKLGIDVESRVIELLIREVNLDPDSEIEIHLELAEKYLSKGKELVEKDTVQASEKLYKAAEECVKALTLHFKLSKILEKIREKGRWSVTDLEKAVEEITDRVGEWFYNAWDHAWILHVWGFHEAKLDSKAIKRRLPFIEKMVNETKKITVKKS